MNLLHRLIGHFYTKTLKTHLECSCGERNRVTEVYVSNGESVKKIVVNKMSPSFWRPDATMTIKGSVRNYWKA
jgi:hypothetical protein